MKLYLSVLLRMFHFFLFNEVFIIMYTYILIMLTPTVQECNIVRFFVFVCSALLQSAFSLKGKTF